MLSVKGIYDGKICPTESFLEVIKDEEEKSLRSFGSSGNAALDFWNNPEENVYQDYRLEMKINGL